MIFRALTLLTLLGVLVVPATPAAAAIAGKASFVRGIATAQGANGAARIVGINAPIYEGDVLRTARNSYAVLKLEDDTKVTLRPNTVFKVEGFTQAAKEPEKEGIFLRLFKGGLRAVTGLIGKRNPRAFRLRAAVATIGIRGTDFEARLCGTDCQEEAKSLTPARPLRTRVIGRVAFLNGTLSAAGRDGRERALALGASLFEGDVLVTGRDAIAVLVFPDVSRITLRGDSRLNVVRYVLDRARPDRSAISMRFTRGAMRVVTGSIARGDPERFELSTPVGDVAVRDAGFELKCEDQCSAREQAAITPLLRSVLDLVVPAAHAQGGPGMSSFVFRGSMEFRLTGGRTLVIDQGKAVFFDGISSPVSLPVVPAYFQNAGAAQQQIDAGTSESVVASTITAGSEQAAPQEGLYVRVVSGDVEVVPEGATEGALAGANENLYLGPNSTAVIKVALGIRLPITPSPEVFTPEVQNAFDLLRSDDDAPETEFECVVQ